MVALGGVNASIHSFFHWVLKTDIYLQRNLIHLCPSWAAFGHTGFIHSLGWRRREMDENNFKCDKIFRRVRTWGMQSVYKASLRSQYFRPLSFDRAPSTMADSKQAGHDVGLVAKRCVLTSVPNWKCPSKQVLLFKKLIEKKSSKNQRFDAGLLRNWHGKNFWYQFFNVFYYREEKGSLLHDIGHAAWFGTNSTVSDCASM